MGGAAGRGHRRAAGARPLGSAEEPLSQEDRERTRGRGVARSRRVPARRRRAALGRRGRARGRRPDQPARRDDHPPRRAGGAGPRVRDAHLRRARPCAGQPALAGAGQGHARVRAADRRSQGHGVGDEDASLRRHPLRVRAGRATSFPISRRTSRGGSSAARRARCTRTRSDRYVAVDPETGRVHGRSPVRAPCARPSAHPTPTAAA